jgi:hypothetical protein
MAPAEIDRMAACVIFQDPTLQDLTLQDLTLGHNSHPAASMGTARRSLSAGTNHIAFYFCRTRGCSPRVRRICHRTA